MSQASSKSLLRDALSATTVKDKGPPVVDGILSITPDTPEVVEWRRSALDITETSSTYLEDEEDVGPRPNELFGKFTWKIENFSEISKRELRSNVFDVGSYKWYILVYPQGCDVCNHLSLFLCVADYDKLLPGWSHFAQFTIAVVNKDPKKSKYSDTLHRFCKKEHDWGWKKFMELSKVLDGFTVADTLVIKAQVQVILDKPSRPFRCLDPQYRRELVRVYLINVEGVCRRFCDDKRARLLWVKDEADKFKDFWLSLSYEQQRSLLVDKAEAVLKGLVKQFFNEKEVTSTLVMDALYSGCKQIEEHSRHYLEGKSPEGPPLVLIRSERNTFTLLGDLLDLADRVTKDFIPMAKDDKMMQPNDGLALRSGQEDDYRRDSIERDEKRLAELGRKTVEMLVISHIITEKMEAAYREAEALKRQDQLILEEFEMQQLEEFRAKVQAEKDKEKKAKKKERVKAKKEAERVKKEAEDAERRKLDEIKRLEQERKAQEAAAADKKRQEEEQQKARQQALARQAQQRLAAAAAGKQAQVQGQAQAQAGMAQQAHAQVQAGKGRQASGAASSAQQQQSAAASGPSSARSVSTGMAQQQQQQHALASQQQCPSQHASTVKQSAGTGTQQAVASQPSAARPAAIEAMSSSSSSGSGSTSGEPGDSDLTDSVSSGEVGTVDQATGMAEASDDSDSTESGGRAELEREVQHLRARVRALEKQLSERDADLFALRAQLSELQPTELADLVRGQQYANLQQSQPAASVGEPQLGAASSAASGAVQVSAAVPALPHPSALSGKKASSEKDVSSEVKSETAVAGPTANGSVLMEGVYGGTASPYPSAPLQSAGSAGAGNRRPAALGPYDTAGAQARTHVNGPNAPTQSHAGQTRTAAGGAPHATQQKPTDQAAPTGSSSASDTQHLLRTGSAGQQYSSLGGAGGAAGQAAAAPGRSNAAVPSDGAAKAGNTASAQSASAVQASSGVAVHSGTAGILHGAGAGATVDATPSYRNAAAGVIPVVPAGASARSAPAAAAAPAAVAAAPPATAGKQNVQQDEPAGPAAAPVTAGTITPQATRHLNHAAAEFTAGTHLMMQTAAGAASQPQGQGGLSFGPVPTKRPQQSALPQMDSPGLDDFAHMGLIDDLLTE